MTAGAHHRIDKFIPWMFVLFFLVVFAVDGFFMATALKTHTGLVTENAYEEGLAYNKALAEAQAQAESGWSHKLNISQNGEISFSLNDKTGKPVSYAKVSALCYRNIQGGMDVMIPLSETEIGVYKGKANLKANGMWRIFITANAGKQTYKTDQDILIER